MTDSLNTAALEALRQATGDDPEFLAELVGTFLEEIPSQLAELRAATASGDADVVRRVAHTLKSNAATFGIVRLADICRELEARASRGDLDGADEHVVAIEHALAEAQPDLHALTVTEGTA